MYAVHCTRSGVIRCTLFMVHYLLCMFHCGFHAVFWLHISVLMSLLAAEPRNTPGLLFTSQYLCGTTFLTLTRPVFKAWPILFYWLKLLVPFLSSIVFSFPFFLSLGLYSGAGVFLLIGYKSLSPGIALSTVNLFQIVIVVEIG